MKQKSHNSTSHNSVQKSGSIKEKKRSKKDLGPYREKYASDFLFMPWPPNKKFFDKLAEDYLNWALDLSRKIRSGELDPSEKLHSLTTGHFLEEAGIPDSTFDDWLQMDDSLLLRKSHQTVKRILGRIREGLALFEKADATHIRATLGRYSNEYKEEREWLANLSNEHNTLGNVVVELPCYKEHKNECRDENKAG